MGTMNKKVVEWTEDVATQEELKLPYEKQMELVAAWLKAGEPHWRCPGCASFEVKDDGDYCCECQMAEAEYRMGDR